MMVVGVPEIAPVEVSKVRPAGNVAEIDQEVAAPPLEVGTTVVMAESLVKERVLGVYVTEDGAMSLTAIVTVALPLPPALLAVTVYAVEVETTVGVPPMAPVEVSKVSPAGSDGEIAQETTGPPLADGVTVVMATPLARVSELGL